MNPGEALAELTEFSRKLAAGAAAMGELGPVTVAGSPKETIHRRDKLALHRYRPWVSKPYPVPLLICYALVNRPSMLDLQEDRSMIQGLLKRGVEVYLVDWGYPGPEDRGLTLENYICDYLHDCVELICRRHHLDALDLLGVCQGGTLSLCYTALYPQRVRKLVTMVTPVDFHTPDNSLSHMVQHLDVDLLVDTLGNVPGELLNFTFLSLSPFRLAGQKYVDLVDIMDDEDALRTFLRMEQWIFDSPDQAGEALRQFVKEFFQHNKLVAGTLSLGGQAVSLELIRQPVLNVYASRDHLVPPAASQALGQHYQGTEYRELCFEGGHIGIYVSARARGIPIEIAAWLQS